MIRDFWSVSPGNLFDEIKAIQSKVEPEIWAAIDALRSVGNIGAHMQRDINVIVDVDPEEASLLIELIELLLEEWYVSRHERQQKLANLVSMAATKKKKTP